MDPSDHVTIDTIRAAAERLRGVALETPLIPFETPAGRQILLKAESLQAIGSFKIRGAYNAIAALGEAARSGGVVAASSGNHAQGVARAARLFGIEATIVMPADAPAIKQARVRADGARVIHWDPGRPSHATPHEQAIALAAERGLPMIHSFDDDTVIAGQGTVGLEVAARVDDLAAVLVPIGGGGLIGGIATAVRERHRNVRIVGVEPALAADAQESFRTGRLVRWPTELGRRTIADGTRVNLSERTFAYIRRLVDDIVTVEESEIMAAVRLVAERARIVAEPSGALTAAAVCFRSAAAGLDRLSGTVVAVISGGNLDTDRLRACLEAPIPNPPG